MASPKDGSPGTMVPPGAPADAHDADVADPGQVEQVKAEQRQTGTGKYGTQPVTPFKPGGGAADSSASSTSSDTTHWIEIALVNEQNKPVAGEEYRITMPDGSVASGTTDDKGKARCEQIGAGTCKVAFPNIDADAWEKA